MTVYIVSAFRAEAAPLIDHYKLKQSAKDTLFPIYEGDDCTWVISGLGKTAAAAATSYLYRYCGEPRDQVWLNIGIAGHRHFSLGTVALAHKIIDVATNQVWHPRQSQEHTIATADLHTVDQTEFNYKDNALYDMEAAGFYSIASKCTTRELAQCCKIISDNTDLPANNSTAKRATRLIAQALPIITEYIAALQTQAAQIKTVL